MQVRIYQPSKTATQSGPVKYWVVEPEYEGGRYIEPTMGWTGTTDTKQQIRIRFDTKEEAINYVKRAGLEYRLIEPKEPKRKRKAYADNFK